MSILRKKTQKGFTLIEMMVAIFIFLLLMTSIVQIFAQQIRAYQHARNVQGDMENAQFAMNYLAKTLRTATVLGDITSGSTAWSRSEFNDGSNPDGTDGNDFLAFPITNVDQSLILYDFSQDRCLKLTFYGEGESPDGYPGAALIMERSSDNPSDPSGRFVGYDEIEQCLDVGMYVDEKRLTTGNVEGSFFASPTRFVDSYATGDRTTDAIGRVTIAMKVLPLDLDEDDISPVYMQTTTSLRDYPSDLSF